MAMHIFSEEEKKKIEEAVKDFELVSNGEVVPYYVPASDDYNEACWYLSAMLGALVSAVTGFLSYTWMLPVQITPFEFSILVLGAMIVGFIIPKIVTPVRGWLISRDQKLQRVNQRAMQAFLSESVFKTQDRVGVLIFISELERNVIVLGDEGINRVVDKAEWEEVVSTVVTGIKEKQLTDGLVKAIGLCKHLMVKNGFLIKSDDVNELPDGLRLGD